MGLHGVISNLLSLGAKLLPAVNASAQAPSSSSSPPVDQNHQIEAELEKLMRMLERIKATLYDAEQREVTDLSVKLWLKELHGVSYDAEDVLDEYHYELLREQVEAIDASLPNSRKRKPIQVPCSMLDQIKKLRSKFDEIANDRISLQLSEGDGPKRCNNELQIAPTSYFVVESNIIGREWEKEKLIENLLSSQGDGVSVVTIVGMGGIGKTTLAQLVYNDQRIQQRFDKVGWICVSEDFNVERLTKESVEFITRNVCDLTNLSVMQEKIQNEISGKRVFLVLDDVWNEKRSFWDSFQAPFMAAKSVKILVTTRNDHVAQVMQTEPTFIVGNLSIEYCWQLFEHYAFGGGQHNKNPKLVEIGKQIMNKCGLLPLAVKSIASLLRHEDEEDSWRDILETELWESNASNEIYTPLKLSYARLPAYLKSCFLYCAMFSKDYIYDVGYIVELWISQGFIESKGKKTAKEIGFEYAQLLCQRSLFEQLENKGRTTHFKLHDIVHDLARLNTENSCYSIEVGKLPVFPKYNLYLAPWGNRLDPIPSDKFTALRTLIIGVGDAENLFHTFDISMAPKLRALEIDNRACKFESLSSVGNLKHLRYLSLRHMDFNFKTLPECISSHYNLRNLTLRSSFLIKLPTKIGNLISLEELIIDCCTDLMVLPKSLCQLKALKKLSIICCHNLKKLPNNIGNLISLEVLDIDNCFGLTVLPRSLCQLKALRKLCLNGCPIVEELPSDMGSLTNLQFLIISGTGVSFLPPSLSKFGLTRALLVELKCKTIGWLKDFPDLKGSLCLSGLENINPNLIDAQCANLVSMHNLEHLILNWDLVLSCDDDEYHDEYHEYHQYIADHVFELITESEDESGENIDLEDESEFSGSGENIHLEYEFSVMVSLQPHPNLSKLKIDGYGGIRFLEWIGSLCKLKYLNFTFCFNLKFLEAESLPLELEELEIFECDELVSIPGIQKLKSLVKLSINDCKNLSSFMEPSTRAGVGSYGSSLLGLTNLASLRSLKISNCSELKVLADELREWCLKHGIHYDMQNQPNRIGIDRLRPDLVIGECYVCHQNQKNRRKRTNLTEFLSE